MEIAKTIRELTSILEQLRYQKKTIGLVPTMGALHKGHLSLIDQAHQHADVVVCSIFVNPTQFNDPKDLEKYPRPITTDIELLRGVGCEVLLMPEVSEMYSEDEKWHIDLGNIEHVLEGAYRPGHYQGVTQIVHKLFSLVKPDVALFGQKDYQQFLVISKMVELFHMPIKLICCPIIREADGLAMSSRNVHLSDAERATAVALNKALRHVEAGFADKDIETLKKEAQSLFLNGNDIDLDYFEACNGYDLSPAKSKDVDNIVLLIAAKVGKTRLIDNIILK